MFIKATIYHLFKRMSTIHGFVKKLLAVQVLFLQHILNCINFKFLLVLHILEVIRLLLQPRELDLLHGNLLHLFLSFELPHPLSQLLFFLFNLFDALSLLSDFGWQLMVIMILFLELYNFCKSVLKFLLLLCQLIQLSFFVFELCLC